MPRVPPHFKVRLSIQNHPKMAAVYADPFLFSLWVKLGLRAIAQFADNTGNSFVVHEPDLLPLTQKDRPARALELLDQLCRQSPLSFRRYCATCEPNAKLAPDSCHGGATVMPRSCRLHAKCVMIHIPNLAKKQGFGQRETAGMGDSSTTTTTTTSKRLLSPAGDPAVREGEKATDSTRKKPCPPPEAIRLAKLWGDLRDGACGPVRPHGAALSAWQHEIRKLLELDGKSVADVEAVIRFLYGANLKREFPFACHSPKNLRRDQCEKFDRIQGAIAEAGKPNRRGRDASTVPPSPEFKRDMEGLTPVSELSDAEIEQARARSAALRAKLGRPPA